MDLNAQQEGAILDGERTQTDAAEMGQETAVIPTLSEGAAAVNLLLHTASEAEVATRGTLANPIGTRDPAHRVHWHGRNINGVEYIGSAETTKEAVAQSHAYGTETCHMAHNPLWVDPASIPPAPQAPKPANIPALSARAVAMQESLEQMQKAEYDKGWADADAAYQDLKALVQLWATEQALAGVNLDEVPMVLYVRNNR